MDIGTLSFYDENAERLSALYECADMGHFYKTVDDLLHGEGCVLDIGCGEGRDVRALGCRGYDVCGCDASVGMIKCAQAKDFTHDSCYGVKAFPVPENDDIMQRRFDLVYSHAMIMHLSGADLGKALCQMSDIVKDGKYLILSWCNRESTDGRVYRKINAAEVEQLLIANGLWVIGRSEDNDSLGRQVKWSNIILQKKGNRYAENRRFS